MELNHLKYFYTVVREGSFTRASKLLRIQQPTVSKMVRSLEAEVGASLLERERRGIKLTPIGKEVFRHCTLIFDQVEAIRSSLRTQSTELQGALDFGVTDSVCSYLIPKVLREFLQIHPKVRPSIFAGSSNLIMEEIRSEKIEFGLFFTGPTPRSFQIEEVMEIPFQLVVASQSAGDPAVKESLILSREIDYPRDRPFPVLEMLEQNRIRFERRIASNNLDSQKQMVKEGLGVALLPRFMVKSGLQKGSLRALYATREFTYSLKLATLSRRTTKRPMSANAERFLEVFRRVIPTLI